MTGLSNINTRSLDGMFGVPLFDDREKAKRIFTLFEKQTRLKGLKSITFLQPDIYLQFEEFNRLATDEELRILKNCMFGITAEFEVVNDLLLT